MVTGHGPLHVRWCFMRQPNQSILWQNFEFRVRAINSLQICSLKPSELCAISFTFCVFLCYYDVSFELRYLSLVYVAKNASATCS